MSNSVANRSPEIEAMLQMSAPCRDLMKGGRHMREQGEAYLPKFPQESEDDYEARLASTWLFDGVGKTIEDLSGKIFEMPITLSETGTDLDIFAYNVDLQGRDISQFARDIFDEAQASGISFIMVDSPARGELTRAQARAGNFRPYFVSLSIDDVLGYKTEVIDNVPTLTQIRIMEVVEEDSDDEFAPDKIEQIRVCTLPTEEGRIVGTVNLRLFRKSADNIWQVYDEYETGMPRIYIAACDIGRDGYMKAKPPHARLAEINLAHWRSQSDQANIMHHARAPMKYFHGYSKEDLEEFTEGAGYAFFSSNENAKIGVVEHSGAAIDAGRTELKDMEFQMQAMGLQLLVSRSGASTATGDLIDEQKVSSRLGMWADNLKDTLELAFAMMAEMADITADINIVINKDFAANALSHLEIDALNKMYLAEVISKQTYINEAKRRNLLSEEVTFADEQDFMMQEPMDEPDNVAADNGDNG